MNDFVFRNFSYGVYVISCMDKERPTGCLANSVMQIAAEPPYIAVSINHDNYTHKCINDTGKFAVSILTEKSNPLIIGKFGFSSGKDIDKFDGMTYTIKSGVPVLDDSCGYIICELDSQVETPTHTVFTAKVTDGEIKDGTPMTYAYYHNVIKGKSPKAAPTYIKE